MGATTNIVLENNSYIPVFNGPGRVTVSPCFGHAWWIIESTTNILNDHDGIIGHEIRHSENFMLNEGETLMIKGNKDRIIVVTPNNE